MGTSKLIFSIRKEVVYAVEIYFLVACHYSYSNSSLCKAEYICIFIKNSLRLVKEWKGHNMTMRKCIVNGKNAYFHQWNTYQNVVEPSPMIGGTPGGQIQYTVALIEFDDGTVAETTPQNIMFVEPPGTRKRG